MDLSSHLQKHRIITYSFTLLQGELVFKGQLVNLILLFLGFKLQTDHTSYTRINATKIAFFPELEETVWKWFRS